LGEAVNFASRLESFAQPCGISVSSRFYSDLSDKKTEFRDHGIQNIKNSSVDALDVVLPSLATRRFFFK
jgi:class 3 adenylate cyclase